MEVHQSLSPVWVSTVRFSLSLRRTLRCQLRKQLDSCHSLCDKACFIWGRSSYPESYKNIFLTRSIAYFQFFFMNPAMSLTIYAECNNQCTFFCTIMKNIIFFADYYCYEQGCRFHNQWLGVAATTWNRPTHHEIFITFFYPQFVHSSMWVSVFHTQLLQNHRWTWHS